MLQSPSCRFEREGWQPSRVRGRIARGVLVARDANERGSPPHPASRRGEAAGPPGGHEVRAFGRPCIPTHEEPCVRVGGANRRHLTNVRVRRARLSVQIVAVIPDDHETKIVDGREDGCAGADDDALLASAHRQPATVPLRGTDLCRQDDMRLIQGCGDTGHVAAIGHDEKDSPAGRARGDCCRGEKGGPCRAGQSRPHRPGGLAGGERSEEGFCVLVLAPGARVERSGCGRCRGSVLRLGFDPGMTRRDGEAKDISERPRIAIGDGTGHPGDLVGEDRLGTDHARQRRQPAVVLDGVIARVTTLEEVAVDQSAGEANAYAGAGHRVVGQRRRDRVVKRAIEMGQRDVHRDPRDRSDGRHRRGIRGVRVRLPQP